MKFLKFIKPAEVPDCPYYSYSGEHRVEHEVYHPQQLNRNLDTLVPKYLQTVTIVRRGKSNNSLLFDKNRLLIAFSIIYLGNECCSSKDGYFPGCHVIFNAGLASHGGGENRGLSKALAMVVVLVICPSHYNDELDWRLAWTPINVLNFKNHFRPILYSLAEALDTHFWVCRVEIG